MDYYEWKIKLSPLKPWNEIVVGYLAEVGFESFVDQADGVDAYIQTTLMDQKEIEAILDKIGDSQLTLSYTIGFLEHQNWNATWEADFEPVYIDDFATILAPFHDKKLAKGMLLEIQPQMSFGTGHHQTTFLMCSALFQLASLPNSVLDMGSGTGILAIVAEKLGAKRCVAVDIEAWSAVNAAENAVRNNCTNIESLHGDIETVLDQKFGMVLANINRNVLWKHLPSYYEILEENGLLFMSGFFETDAAELIEFAESIGFQYIQISVKETWACLQFKK